MIYGRKVFDKNGHSETFRPVGCDLMTSFAFQAQRTHTGTVLVEVASVLTGRRISAASAYTVLHSATQYYTVLHNFTQYYTVLHSATQYYTILHSTTQYYIVLHSLNRYLIQFFKKIISKYRIYF